MKKSALIVKGGWDGHEPDQVGAVFEDMLTKQDFDVEVSDTLDSFADAEKLSALDLIVPIWTMGEIDKKLVANVVEAVANGVGLAGCHGGMCDSFRESVEWEFMTGGAWVSHPGGDGVEHVVNIKKGSSPLVEGLKDFTVKSEQYYMHVDPVNEVLATTRFPVVNWYHAANGPVDIPVVWTRRWGVGRVYYNSLGHHADILQMDTPAELMRRGFLWAAEGKEIARREGLDSSFFKSEAKMF